MQALRRSVALRRRELLFAWALVLPAVLVIAAVIVYPVARALQMSVLGITLLNLRSATHAFVGLANYARSLADPAFWQSLKNTGVWAGANLAAQMALGLSLALLLDQPLKGRGAYRALTLIPYIVPSVTAVLTWLWIYDANNGLLNAWLVGLHLIPHARNWLGDIGTVLWAIIVESVWKGTPFVVLLLLAGLQGIPRDAYDAAAIDGASNLQTLWYVILPLIRRNVAIAAALTLAFTVNNFNAIWLMTQGGPLHASDTVLTYAYKLAFQNFNLGEAAAVSVLIFVFMAAVSAVYIGLTERGE